MANEQLSAKNNMKAAIKLIQQKITKLLRSHGQKTLAAASRDNCSELSRLVGIWILKKFPHATVDILQGTKVMNTNSAHDIVAATFQQLVYIIDPTVWQFFPYKKSILITTVANIQTALQQVAASYHGNWQIAEKFNPRHYSAKKLMDTVLLSTTLIVKTQQFVRKSFSKNTNDIIHALRTAYWIKKLKPDADDALIVAGLTHDIERAVYGDWKKGSDNPKLLQKHQRLSALIAKKFLKELGADRKFCQQVAGLILHHETGGQPDENILCDADCLAFLEKKAKRILNQSKHTNTQTEAKRRIKMVINRIHSTPAKRHARSMIKFNR
jgi:CRISPR/Cas system-associated endonuclease Cas3-HD